METIVVFEWQSDLKIYEDSYCNFQKESLTQFSLKSVNHKCRDHPSSLFVLPKIHSCYIIASYFSMQSLFLSQLTKHMSTESNDHISKQFCLYQLMGYLEVKHIGMKRYFDLFSNCNQWFCISNQVQYYDHDDIADELATRADGVDNLYTVVAWLVTNGMVYFTWICLYIICYNAKIYIFYQIIYWS